MFENCQIVESKMLQSNSHFHAFFKVQVTDQNGIRSGASREKIVENNNKAQAQNIIDRYPNGTRVRCYAPVDIFDR